jgi:hypothetical protein
MPLAPGKLTYRTIFSPDAWAKVLTKLVLPVILAPRTATHPVSTKFPKFIELPLPAEEILHMSFGLRSRSNFFITPELKSTGDNILERAHSI